MVSTAVPIHPAGSNGVTLGMSELSVLHLHVRELAKGRYNDAHAVTWVAGLRQVRPGGRMFPAWFDIYPNSELVQQVEAPVCVLHVRSPLLCSALQSESILRPLAVP